MGSGLLRMADTKISGSGMRTEELIPLPAQERPPKILCKSE